MKYTFKPQGVCSVAYEADVDKGIIKSLKIVGGCPGNTQAVCRLVQGQTLDWAINRLAGIDCRNRGTSCPDQVAKFFMEIRDKQK